MAEIRVEVEIAAPPAAVWADIRDITTHIEWMSDAETIAFTSDRNDGVGTTFDCATRIGLLRLSDSMEITEWAPPETMGVRHVGLVTGTGQFTLTPIGDGRTRFSWSETLRFPWWMGGPVGAWIGRPVLTKIWRRNLTALAARFD